MGSESERIPPLLCVPLPAHLWLSLQCYVCPLVVFLLTSLFYVSCFACFVFFLLTLIRFVFYIHFTLFVCVPFVQVGAFDFTQTNLCVLHYILKCQLCLLEISKKEITERTLHTLEAPDLLIFCTCRTCRMKEIVPVKLIKKPLIQHVTHIPDF